MDATSTVYAGYPSESSGPHVVTIGSFDGVHRGHQHLLERVRTTAQSLGALSAAVTFDPLPSEFLAPDRAPKRLSSTADRLDLLQACGIDEIIVLAFNDVLAGHDPQTFIHVLVTALLPIRILVGSDFAFGHRRSGTVETLGELGQSSGFEVEIIQRVNSDSGELSSTRTRQSLLSGDVETAREILDRPYWVRGTVVHGNHRGRTLGFPTANLQISDQLLVPGEGIYAAMTQIDRTGPLLPSMVYIGNRPTFDDEGRTVEVNLLNFDRDIYGHELTVLFVRRIRGDRSFDHVSDLILQMTQDREETISMLGQIDADWPGSMTRSVLGLDEGVANDER